MICEICGLEIGKCGMGTHLKRTHKIEPEKYYNMYIGKPNICVCGKPTKFINVNNGYYTYYSQNCSRRHTLEKTKQKYNVSNISQVESVKTKMSKSIKNNWANLSEKEYKNRCSSISYGTIEGMKEYSLNYEKEVNKYCLENNLIRVKDLEQIYGSGFIQSKALMYTINIIIYKHSKLVSIDDVDKIAKYSKLRVRSKTELILYNIVKEICNDAILNYRKLSKRELDIYIPSKQIAIEYNGTYWHSIESGTKTDFHLNKSIECRNNGIRLIHIYEFEDFEQQINNLIILLKDDIDLFDKNFNKNNIDCDIPTACIVFKNDRFTVYGAGPLY